MTDKSIYRMTVSQILRNMLEELAKKPSIKISEIKSLLHDQGFCLLMIFFAIPCILPVPGISTIAGFPLIFISLQMILGYDSPWLPKWISAKSVGSAHLISGIEKTLPYFNKLEKLFKPRLHRFAEEKAEKIIAIIWLIFAIYIVMPVIFGNLLPSLGIIFLSLGILNRDGLMIIIGTILGFIGVMLASIVIVAGLEVIHLIFNKLDISFYNILNFL